ncbi:cysteine hydrolase [bacterium]|nr:cysteine hydrolase [bacterium]
MKTILKQLLSKFLASSGEFIESSNQETYALLLIDLQNDFLRDDGKMPVDQSLVKPLIDQANSIGKSLNAMNIPIIYILNEFKKSDKIGNFFRNNASVKDSYGAQVDDRVMIFGNLKFSKSKPDSFSNPKLEDFLKVNKINHLLIAGVFSDQCVFYTTKAALNRRYKVTILQDGTASANLKKLKESLDDFKQLGIEVLSKDQILSRIEPSSQNLE